jgi:lysozyme family protein
MSHFPSCIHHILNAEGGLVKDPNDPGGQTQFGISKRQYPDLDIPALTKDDARAIYLRDYWQPIQGDALPAGLNLVLLDHAINAGVKTAVRILQRLVGCPDDGVIGPVTLAAITTHDPQALIAQFCDGRLDFYRALPGWHHYAGGWTRRVQRMRRFALAMTRDPLVF